MFSGHFEAPGLTWPLRACASGILTCAQHQTCGYLLPASMRFHTLADEGGLRSLPWPGGGRRSVFAPDGIVPGTQRGERWLFWPMGIASPGAMRQWGRQPTAFVGRRHFDDPWLMDVRFERRGSPAP